MISFRPAVDVITVSQRLGVGELQRRLAAEVSLEMDQAIVWRAFVGGRADVHPARAFCAGVLVDRFRKQDDWAHVRETCRISPIEDVHDVLTYPDVDARGRGLRVAEDPEAGDTV